jgi:hypothetical protein
MTMRLVPHNIYPWAAAFAALVFVLSWFLVDGPPPSKAQPPIAEAWSLPPFSQGDPNAETQTIVARNLWGTVAAATAAPPVPQWRVMGIASSGADRYVLLAYEGKPIEILKVGDALPDGLKIVQIENERFFVTTADRKKIAFGIYKNDSTK